MEGGQQRHDYGGASEEELSPTLTLPRARTLAFTPPDNCLPSLPLTSPPLS